METSESGFIKGLLVQADFNVSSTSIGQYLFVVFCLLVASSECEYASEAKNFTHITYSSLCVGHRDHFISCVPPPSLDSA